MILVAVDQLDFVLEERRAGPIVALLTDSAVRGDFNRQVAVIVRLLKSGCDYFVCFGRDSERLHDEVDALAEREAGDSECTVITTWHVDESASDVAEFFINVAGARDISLLIGIVGPDDSEMQTSLAQIASRMSTSLKN
ncbi:MAG: DUF7684 family protein [Blastocatellia bacterium]